MRATSATRLRLTSALTVAALSLVPWAVYFVVEAVTDVLSGADDPTSLSDLSRPALPLLTFVALPSALPLAVARTRVLRGVTLLLMTAATAITSVTVTASDDAQSGLALLWVPTFAIALAAVLWVGQTIAASRAGDRPAATAATFSDRLAALAVDVLIVEAALIVPLTALSHAKKEVAAVVVGVGAATSYFAGLVAARGHTVGQSLLGLTVVDAQTLRRPAPARAIVRSLVVVLEVAGVWMVVLSPPAIIESVSTLLTGRSVTDRILRTSVITTGRNSL